MAQCSRTLDGAIRSLFVLLAATLVPATAGATSRTKYALSYDARPSLGCPQAEQLRAAVAAELGYEPFADDASTALSITVRPSRAGVRGRVEMRLADGRRVGQRELTASSCEELTAALVLTVVMAIDPMRSVVPPKPTKPTKPQPQAQVAPTNAIAPVAKRKPFDLDRPHLFIAADAHLAIQTAPAPAFGSSADVGVAAPHWSVAVELRGDVPSGADVLGARVTASLLLASFVPCGRYGFAAVCAIVGGGGQLISGAGASYWVGYGTAGARLELLVPVSRRIALLLRIDGVAPLIGKEAHVQSWRSPIAVSVGAGISVRATNDTRE